MTKITISLSDNTIEIHSDQMLKSNHNTSTEVDLPRVREQPLPMNWNIESKVRELRFKMWDAAYVECEGNKTKMFVLLGYANYQTLANQMKSNGYIIPKNR